MGPENIWTVAIGGGASFIASMLYAIGGTEMSFGGKKWLRRYLGTFILALSTSVIALILGAWSWKLILIYPCLIGGMSLGYGGDTTGEKLIRRAVFASGVLMACVVGLWYVSFSVNGWIMFGLASFIGLTSVVMGVWNPFKNAPLEQYLICQVLTMFIPFWGFIY
jgi:hypothetical protein